MNTSLPSPTAFSVARQHAEEAARLAVNARTTGASAIHHAILCGIELIRLRTEHPEFRGGNHQKPHDAVFGWAQLVQHHVGISDDTARRWMAAARKSLDQIGSGPAEFLALPEPDRREIEAKLEGHVTGKSLKDLARIADDPPAKPVQDEEPEEDYGEPRRKVDFTNGRIETAWQKTSPGGRTKWCQHRLKDLRRIIAKIESRRADYLKGKAMALKNFGRHEAAPKTKPKTKPAKKGQKS